MVDNIPSTLFSGKNLRSDLIFSQEHDHGHSRSRYSRLHFRLHSKSQRWELQSGLQRITHLLTGAKAEAEAARAATIRTCFIILI